MPVPLFSVRLTICSAPFMGFHLGKPILTMIFLAGGAWMIAKATQRADHRADVEVWCFSDQHYRAFTGSGQSAGYVSPLTRFESETGLDGEIKLIQNRALNTRLGTMFMSGTKWPELPDCVEIEIGSVGRYFRPPVDEVGLLPLNDFIERHGWKGKIVEARLAPWSKHGTVFGIPADVHPVMITYNDDLFSQAGVDLASSATWDQFIDNCRRYEKYWRDRGEVRRRAFELNQDNATWLLAMLLQRGVNVIDDRDQIFLEDERVVDTLVTYCQMLAGPDSMAVATSGGRDAYATDLTRGYVGAMFTPDWRFKYLKDAAPALRGKLKVMPLPRWPDSPYRTSTIGGTMIGIPRNARDPEAAWKMIEQLYLRPEALREMMKATYVLPPIKSVWDDPMLMAVDPYYGNQTMKQLIVDMADEVPPRYVSPASSIAEGELAMVMIEALEHMRTDGEVGLREKCRVWLARAAASTQRRIEHGSFE